MPRPPGGPLATDDEDEDTYEEAHPYNTAKNLERAESDSSYYESYGEEEEEEEEAEHVKDRAHYIQWSASQPCLRPAPESRLCGYLWRRRWLGQWTKQLFIIRNRSLLCYKCARDLLPQTEVNLRGCQLVYKVKTSGRVQHQLKLLLPGSHTLVLGYSTSQQAHEWRKVIEELSEEQNLSGTTSESLWSCRSSAVLTHNDQEDPPSHHNKDKDFLNVLMNCQWQSLLCQVEAGLLNMFGEDGDEEAEPTRRRPPQYTLQLRGCAVEAGPDDACSQRIILSVLGDQVAVLEVSSADEKRRWTRLLKDGAAGYRSNKARQEVSPPRTNTYMDPPLYSNTSLLEHMLHSSQDARCGTYANAVLAAHNAAWRSEVGAGGQEGSPPEGGVRGQPGQAQQTLVFSTVAGRVWRESTGKSAEPAAAAALSVGEKFPETFSFILLHPTQEGMGEQSCLTPCDVCADHTF
nr:actin filament-associated protein 1-like 2 isoform X3 [Nerophis lumbriciformis]XP_061835952.1 actin filament-associated protein 1-like 2 isoform X3 [Nerophis lumbriciformis]